MGAIITTFISVASTGLMLFLSIIINTLVGGIVGCVVGWTFPYVITALNQVGHLNLAAFEIGATLGFVGSFFRSRVKQ